MLSAHLAALGIRQSTFPEQRLENAMQDPLASLDAVAQAELVQRREVTPLDLVDAAIARIERLDPLLGAVVCPLFEEARGAARGVPPGGPFRGVPFLMKDVGATQAGQPQWMGNRALRDAGYKAARDTYLGARLRRAGLVTVGKSKVPEFGLQSTTQPLAFGPTHNPWDLARSPSGSSGGACAAVAAGLVPIAHANDGAGSIRLPAAWCGLVGLKPSRGRIALEPTWIGRSFVGFAVTRSVRDAAVLLDAVHGNEPGDLFVLAEPRRPYQEELGADPGSLRIGLLAEMRGGSLHPECRLAVETAARRLEALGHRVEIAWPEALFEEERALRMLAFGPLEYRMCLRTLAGLLGRPVEPGDVEPYLWTLAGLEWPPVTAEDYLEAAEWRQGWAVRVASWWAGGFDLLVTPTLCEPPALLSELAVDAERPWDLLERIGPHMVFTEPFNVTGQPAISLPLHWTPEGLPVGVQLVAAIGREDLLLRVASQLERELPWSGRRPPVHA
jgi:amidase